MRFPNVAARCSQATQGDVLSTGGRELINTASPDLPNPIELSLQKHDWVQGRGTRGVETAASKVSDSGVVVRKPIHLSASMSRRSPGSAGKRPGRLAVSFCDSWVLTRS